MNIVLPHTAMINDSGFKYSLTHSLGFYEWRTSPRSGVHYLILFRRRALFRAAAGMSPVFLFLLIPYFSFNGALVPLLAIAVFILFGTLLYLLYTWRKLLKISQLPVIRIKPGVCVTFYRRGKSSLILTEQKRFDVTIKDIKEFYCYSSCTFEHDGCEFNIYDGRSPAYCKALFLICSDGEKHLIMTSCASGQKKMRTLAELTGKEIRQVDNTRKKIFSNTDI